MKFISIYSTGFVSGKFYANEVVDIWILIKSFNQFTNANKFNEMQIIFCILFRRHLELGEILFDCFVNSNLTIWFIGVIVFELFVTTVEEFRFKIHLILINVKFLIQNSKLKLQGTRWCYQILRKTSQCASRRQQTLLSKLNPGRESDLTKNFKKWLDKWLSGGSFLPTIFIRKNSLETSKYFAVDLLLTVIIYLDKKVLII